MDNFSRIAQEVLLAYFIPGFLCILFLLFIFDYYSAIDIVSLFKGVIKEVGVAILITFLFIFSQIMGFFLDTIGHSIEGLWYEKIKNRVYFRGEKETENWLTKEINKDPRLSNYFGDKKLLIESFFAKRAKDRVYYRRNWEYCYYEAGRNIALIWGLFIVSGVFDISKRLNIPLRCSALSIIGLLLLLLYFPLRAFTKHSLEKYFRFHVRAAIEEFIDKKAEEKKSD